MSCVHDSVTCLACARLNHQHLKNKKRETKLKIRTEARCGPSTDRGSRHRVAALTKKLFATDTCWQGGNPFSKMETHWACRLFPAASPCPGAGGQHRPNSVICGRCGRGQFVSIWLFVWFGLIGFLFVLIFVLCFVLKRKEHKVR